MKLVREVSLSNSTSPIKEKGVKSLLIALNGVFSGKAMVQLIIFGKFSLTFLYLKIIFLSPINM